MLAFALLLACAHGPAPAPDADADGYPATVDCDDGDAARGPASTWYADTDGDGWGQRASLAACEPPERFAAVPGDCDDADPTVHPGAAEVCNGKDDDCDGGTDGLDLDGDGHPAPDCGGDDCDDTNPEVNPDAREVCADGWDNDCDGTSNGCALEGRTDPSTADRALTGTSPGGRAGRAVGFGDTDGDGTFELLVGAYLEQEERGVAWVVPWAGSGSESLEQAARTTFTGAMVGDRAGRSMAIVGDRLALGATGRDLVALAAGTGSVDLETAAEWVSTTAGEDAGRCLAVAELLDGEEAVAVGAPMGPHGRVYVMAARRDSASLDEADAVVEGDVAAGRLGGAVASADLDGDGVAELAVGSDGEADDGANAGATYVFSGPLEGEVRLDDAVGRRFAQAGFTWFGISLAIAPDLDGDGEAELLVGAQGDASAGTYAGAVFVYPGPVAGDLAADTASGKLTGESPGDLAGASVATSDTGLVVGAPGRTEQAELAGAAYLVRGPVAGVWSLAAADFVVVGDAAEQGLGYAVAAYGDRAEEVVDLLVGAHGWNESRGVALLWWGGAL